MISIPVRPRLRRTLACTAVAFLVGALPGCARYVDGTPVGERSVGLPRSSSRAKSPPLQEVDEYDISRISQLRGEFPPGFDRVQDTRVATLGPDADNFFTIGVGDIVKVDPPLCRSVLQPVRAPQDAQFSMIGGIGQGAIMVGAVSSPAPLVKAVPKGCEQVAVTQRLAGRRVASTVTRRPGPSIEGVVTTESIAAATQSGTKSYVFAAFLSDTVAVAAEGILPGNPDAEDLLGGMLVKAVRIIRAP